MVEARIRIGIALLAFACLGCSTGPGAAAVDSVERPAGRAESDVIGSERWAEVDRLIDEQKNQAAVDAIRAIRAEASAAGEVDDWTRALVLETQLTASLGSVETAVRLVADETWPDDAEARIVLDLLYAHSLTRYLDYYGWEIGQRERIGPRDQVDLTQWTREQLLEAVDEKFAALWAERGNWGGAPLGVLEEYVEPNTYPRRIRGTRRDALAHLWVEVLANSGYWSPAESNGVYRLDFGALASGEGIDPLAAEHPLSKLSALLADLERWHAAEARPEAGFDAFLTRIETLWSHAGGDDERRLLRDRLSAALEELGERQEWWAVGQALLARMVQESDEPGALVAARDLAARGARLHPSTVGGDRCAHLVAVLEAPSFTLEAMRSDGAGRPSVVVHHKNVERLHFRAYHLDLEKALTAGRDYNLLPSHQAVEKLLARGRGDLEWVVELPPTADLREHRTFVTPRSDGHGLYVLVASASPEFRPDGNRVQAIHWVQTDLVLFAASEGRELKAEVLSGETGDPLSGVEVALWQLDYRSGHRRVIAAKTGEEGSVTLTSGGERRVDAIAIAKLGDDVTFERVSLVQTTGRRGRESDEALVYTDRSVYRPGHDVLWKVVAYRRAADEERLTVRPDAAIRVDLLDANYQEVATVEVETNEFGSASGSFELPSGRLLGSWQIRTSAGGQAQIQVEEYKRPTFEVTLDEPAESLRLNRPAEIRGEARYYFGLPLVEGAVRWRVTREPRYPRWWGSTGGPRQRGSEVIAAGETALTADGTFSFAFTPAADEREAAGGVAYHYRVDAETTDAGGETRSARRGFTLGFVAVTATIERDQGFFTPDAEPEMAIHRTDLDGVGRSGTALWRLIKLAVPDRVTLPAEEPLPAPEEGERYVTPGDLQRPRWATGYGVESRLRSWVDGLEIARGRLEHGEDGGAQLQLPQLEPGAYRLRYETEDPFGATFETQDEFVVAGPSPLPLPAFLEVQQRTVEVGGAVRILVHSGLADQKLVVEIARPGRKTERRDIASSSTPTLLEIPVAEADRGGVQVRLRTLRDYQPMTVARSIVVPPIDRGLHIRFATFRDLLRPGSRERWKITLTGGEGEALDLAAAEVLTYMYDRSLDLFAPHDPPRPPSFALPAPVLPAWRSSLGQSNPVLQRETDWYRVPAYPHLQVDRIRFFESYGIGGPGRLRPLQRIGGPQVMDAPAAEMAVEATAAAGAPMELEASANGDGDLGSPDDAPPTGGGEDGVRTDFSETAFWEPHLLTNASGAVSFDFEVPDSVTQWNVWVHALTRDLRYGSLEERVHTVKDLLVRPYLPRFLREGDRAEIRVVVQNAGETPLAGALDLDLIDPRSEASVATEFAVLEEARSGLAFDLEPGGSETFTVTLTAPPRVGDVAVKVEGRAGDWSDGELRSLPLLPGRYHLSQSRFAALDGAGSRTLTFEDLAADGDPTRVNDSLVVTVDAQLFQTVLGALPYLVDYPYECTEQTLNRYLSTGIVSSVFADHPAVARLAERLAERETRLEPWDADDPNRAMALVETPWLRAAAGGSGMEERLIRLLDPAVARAQRDASLAGLRQAQTSLGGFPWWPGGPPSPYMTLYILSGLSRALEFGVEVPRDLVTPAWSYLKRHYVEELVAEMKRKGGRHETLTLLNFVLSSYPDDSWTGGVFSDVDRRRILDHSFEHWKEHSPLLKGYLALTLQRAGRADDARLVFDSVMDSAKTSDQLGTYWAPEDRAWLWYNDTIETHALALRVLGELDPADPRRRGLVHWLLLNKKLNHWKSTRATAEVLYSLVHYLAAEGQLGQREEAIVTLAGEARRLVFEPDDLAGRQRQIVVPGEELGTNHATTTVENETSSLLFASATWHFSTEELPTEARSDFFGVERRYFRRFDDGAEWRLEPLAEGTRLAPGDQIEVHLSLTTRHAAEYVHLRDPRAAGFEPEGLTSGYRWDLGIGWYEQVRDSGTDFFFEWLPVGEYTFRYRLRASLGGTFKAGPATVQSMYAPEFAAYSSGATLAITGD